MHAKRHSLVQYLDPNKISPESLSKAQYLVHQHAEEGMASNAKHYPIQVDTETYKLLKTFKSKYDVFFYDAIKESLLTISAIIKK